MPLGMRFEEMMERLRKMGAIGPDDSFDDFKAGIHHEAKEIKRKGLASEEGVRMSYELEAWARGEDHE